MKKSKSPAIPSMLRAINERRVLDGLRESGALHAAEIARINGLSRPTTSLVLKSLTQSGLVQEYFPGESDSKRAKSVFEAVSDVKLGLGIDIGAKFIRVALGDLTGKTLSQESFAVKKLSLSEILETIKTGVDQVLKTSKHSIKDVASIVVGTPGVIDQKSGKVAIAGTIDSLDGVNLGKLIQAQFKITPLVENDINLVTIAEQGHGFGNGKENFAVLSIGSGIGSGLVLNGKLHRGHRGAAGEIFYIPFGDPFDTHKTATNPSADLLPELAKNLASKYRSTSLKTPYSNEKIMEAARMGDSLGLAVVNEEAARIALYIAGIASVVDVEVVILSGGIGRQADVLLDPIISIMAKILPFPPKIEVSKLGDSAVLIGAIDIATDLACDLVFEERMAGNYTPTKLLEIAR